MGRCSSGVSVRVDPTRSRAISPGLDVEIVELFPINRGDKIRSREVISSNPSIDKDSTFSAYHCATAMSVEYQLIQARKSQFTLKYVDWSSNFFRGNCFRMLWISLEKRCRMTQEYVVRDSCGLVEIDLGVKSPEHPVAGIGMIES